ncbi:MAG: YebC/PmpR family DNA-binding transcriptional regulator [Proteobacteria bacterium]|nr:YebC/PmpR family DNA-binding transcriptional regulator [Pseudomonadota bacterium]
MGAQWKMRGKLINAAARSKVFTKLQKEILMAARGGADPNMNARLRAAVEAAKKGSLPRDNIERAIMKGAGIADDSVQYELVTYEGFAPHRVPIVVECLTDNRNRTTNSIRVLFRKGQLAATGAVTWDFAHVGLVDATGPGADVDVEEAAIESGAQDFEPDDEHGTRFYTEPADLDAVSKALSARGWTVATMRLGWRAKNPVTIPAADRPEVEAFLAAIDDDDDVQHIYVGLAD